ncbi:MAG: hypothetical protein BWY64_03697 [bacterium ADurb.Bin363]|nr:MAG: hypothetical protein BWY64_03697 [bacterium ADurb.Bin363]
MIFREISFCDVSSGITFSSAGLSSLIISSSPATSSTSSIIISTSSSVTVSRSSLSFSSSLMEEYFFEGNTRSSSSLSSIISSTSNSSSSISFIICFCISNNLFSLKNLIKKELVLNETVYSPSTAFLINSSSSFQGVPILYIYPTAPALREAVKSSSSI